MNISDIVADQRRRLGLKQYELAERTGIAPSQLSVFERGGSGMVTSNLEKLLEALSLHIVFDRGSVQREKALETARVLRHKGLTDLRLLSREEVATIMENEDMLLMPVVSDELFRQYCKSELIDETHTWNHFIKLVHEALLNDR